MSFWDKISDGWNWTKQAGASLGGALSAAYNAPGEMAKSFDANVAFPAIGKADQGLATGLGALGKADNWIRGVPVLGSAYGLVTEPATLATQGISAGYKGVDTALITNNPFDLNDWRNSWNKADQISLGQAAAADVHSMLGDKRPGIGTNGVSPEEVAARQAYYENTNSGKLQSGIIDLVVNVKTPFGEAVGAGAGAIRDASRLSEVTGGAEIKNAVDIAKTKASGGDTAGLGTRRSQRFGNYLHDIAANHTNGSATEIFNNPLWKRSGIAGSLAPLLSDINGYAMSETEKLSLKIDVLGAAYGNSASWSRLADMRPDIAAQVDNFGKPPLPNLTVDFGPDYTADATSNPVTAANADPMGAPEAQAYAKEIDARLERMNSFMSEVGAGQGALTSFKPRLVDSAAAKVLDTDILGGIGSRPIRVVTTSIMNKVPGGVSTKDVGEGFTSLQGILRQSYWTDAATREGLLNQYAKASNPGERMKIIQDAVTQYNRDIAAHYGLNAAAADEILRLGVGKQQAYIQQAKSRLYSADEDAKTIETVDPETGQIQHTARPLMQSQIEDHVSVPNPRELDAAYARLAKDRMLDDIAGDHILFGDKLVDTIDQWSDRAKDGLDILSNVWKHAQLMQFRYGARVQVDSQIRNALYMGALPTLHGALKTTRTTFGKKGIFAFSDQGADRVKLSSILKGETLSFMWNYMKMSGVDTQDIPMLIRTVDQTGGDLHSLILGTTDHLVSRARATGEWGPLGWDNPNYMASYIRDVNQQVRNSPTAMKILEGVTDDDLYRLSLRDPALRKEWASLSSGFHGDKALFIGKLQSAVNHLLPTPEHRAVALQRDITKEDIEGWYPQADGPVVHGEAWFPTDKNSPWFRTMDWLGGLRDGFYKMMSDAPDMVLARMPLFTHEFQRQLKRVTQMTLQQQKVKDIASLDPALLDNIRNTAAALARKRTTENMWNMHRVSNLSRTFRYISPFMSAWEDTMKAYSGIIYDKPSAGIHMVNLWNTPNNLGLIQDENGNQIDALGNYIAPNGVKLDPNNPAEARLMGQDQRFIIPIGFLPKAIRGDATRLSVSKNSLNLVFQGDPWWLPGTGPIAQYPVNEIVKNWWAKGENNALVKLVLPYGVQGRDGNALDDIESSVLPTYMRDGIDALTQGPKWMNYYTQVLAMQQRDIDDHKRADLDPDAAAKSATRMMILGVALDNASPVRAEPQDGAQLYVDMYHVYKALYPSVVDPAALQPYTQKYGQKLGPLMYRQDHPDADMKFLQDFPDLGAMTVSLSSNETGIVATLKAVDDYKDLKPVVDAHPEFGWAIIGPDNAYGTTNDTAFSQAANDFLKMQGARGGTDPVTAINKSEANRGWTIYNQGMTRLRLTLESRGLTNFTQKGAEDLQALKQQFQTQLATEVPAWGRDFAATDGGKAVALLDSMNSLVRMKPQSAQRGDVQAFQQYIAGRAWMKQQLAARVANGGASTLTAKSNADLAQKWDAFTGELIQNNVGFESAYNRVLQNDDLSGDVK